MRNKGIAQKLTTTNILENMIYEIKLLNTLLRQNYLLENLLVVKIDSTILSGVYFPPVNGVRFVSTEMILLYSKSLV